MKLFNVITVGLALAALSSCKNSDKDFPDFEGGTSAYFANQYPVRTICLGESETFTNDLDNEHKCEIYATMGGSYKGSNGVIDIAVDPTLVQDLYFDLAGTKPVKVMPSDYYQLSGNQINYNGEMMGCVGVQLTDKFFADAASLTNTYVIPLKMGSFSGFDRVITGKTDFNPAPSPNDIARWEARPQDFVLYCVKYINQWDGKYINKISDHFELADGTKVDSVSTNMFGDQKYDHPVLELCGIVDLQTLSLSELKFTKGMAYRQNGVLKTASADIKITVDGEGKCTLTSLTEGVTVSGSGRFEKKTDEVWNNKKRDAFYLDYTLTFADGDIKTCTAKDVLVAQTRGVSFEVFTPSYIKK